MKTLFQVVALSGAGFQHLAGMSDEELANKDIRRMVVDRNPGFPCRVSLEDAAVGEIVFLLPYKHHNVTSPYRAAGPIFVREAAQSARLAVNEIPAMIRHRELSVRAYDAEGFMKASRVFFGESLEAQIEEFFSNDRIAYLQVHNAGPGCFNCQINRV